MTTDTWNPAQYDKFQREREQPFFDVLAMIQPAPRMRIVDLGCGTGRLTRELHERLQGRETIGIDRSARMLAAQEGVPLPPGLSFRQQTVEAFLEQDEDYRNDVLPPDVRSRVVVEAATTLGWDRIATDDGAIVGMTTFGASAPQKALYQHFGFTPEHVAEVAKQVAERNAE